jgi:hypothetical protein
MDCNRTRDLLSEFVDDALSGDAKARLEEHVAGCPACAEELESLRRVVTGVRGLGKVAAPDDLLRGVMSGIERAAPAPARFTGFRRIYPLAAAAAFLAALTAIFFMIEDERTAPGLDSVADLDGDTLFEKQEAPHGMVDGFLPRDKAESLRRLGYKGDRKSLEASRDRSEVMDELADLSGEAEEERENGPEVAAESREYLKKVAPGRPVTESEGKRAPPPGDLRGTEDAEVSGEATAAAGGKGRAQGPKGPAAPAPSTPARSAPLKLHADYNVLVVETDEDWDAQAAELGARRVPLKQDASDLLVGNGRMEARQAPQVALYEVSVSDVGGLVRELAGSGAEAVHACAVPEMDEATAEAIHIGTSEAGKVAGEKARAPVTLWSRSEPPKEGLARLGALGYSAGRVDLAGLVRNSLDLIDREERAASEARKDDVPDEKRAREVAARSAVRRKNKGESDLDRVKEEPAVTPRKILILFVRKDRPPPAAKPR